MPLLKFGLCDGFATQILYNVELAHTFGSGRCRGVSRRFARLESSRTFSVLSTSGVCRVCDYFLCSLDQLQGCRRSHAYTHAGLSEHELDAQHFAVHIASVRLLIFF